MNLPAFVDHLGWVLIHSLWQFAAIALLAGLVVWMLLRSSSVARYGVWVIAMGVAVAAPVVTWVVLPMEEPSFAVAVPLARAEAIAPLPIEPIAEAPLLPRGITMAGDLPAENTELGDPPLIASALPAEEIPPLSWSERVTALLRPWMAWIVAGWCVGVVLYSLRPLLGWHTLWRLRTVGVAPVSDDIRAALRNVSDRLRLCQTVQVLQSTLSQVPVVVGYLRPVILLPVSLLTSMPPAQLEAILAHELAHIRRHDFVVNLLQTLVETLFFYHPAVWWLSRQIRIEREHCCDDLVVAALGNRVEYGRALLAIEELRGERTLLALGANDGSLLSRIRRIVGLSTDRSAYSPWAAIGLIVCLLGTLGVMNVFGWHDQGEKANESDPLPTSFIASLPDGLTVEVLGVCPPGAMEAAKCWQPDGGPFADVGQWPKPFSPAAEDATHEFLVRLTGRQDDQDIGCDMPTMRQSWSRPKNGVVERYSIHSSDRTASFRIGISEPEWGPWQTLAADTGEIVAAANVPKNFDYVYRTIVPHHIQKFEGQTGLVWSNLPKNYLAIMQVVAVDKLGKTHERYGASAWGPKDPLHMDMFKLAPEAIDHFEYRLRPFRHWVTFENISLVAGTKSDVKITVTAPPKPAVAEWSDGRSIELVGITKNTAPAKDGWLPSGLPIGDVGYWKATTVLHSGNTSGTYVENGPHPEPDADAIDFLFRFRGLKAQPSLTFDLPANGSSYSHWPVADPYQLRVSARKRGPQPPGGRWSPPDGVVRVGLTDEPWGRWVRVSPEGNVLNPIQPDELYASTYKLIEVIGNKMNKRISTGVAIVFREPAGHKDPDNPDHQYAWEYRAIDNESKEHWALQWEGSNNESQYGLAQPLPAGKTLSHYEYRVRPYRHWVTFKNVSLQPGPQTDVKVTTQSWPAAPTQIRVLNALGKPAIFNTISMVHVGFPQKPMPKWVGWRNRHGLVPLDDLPFGIHWIVAAAEFEQRTIFPLTYPTGEKEIEWRLRNSEAWTQRDLEFKTRFEPGEKTGGDIVITIKNKFDQPLKLTEADFSLHVGERTMHRVMTPQWVDGKFTPVEIAAGQSGEVRLNWNDWVRKGFWGTRASETISEPALPPNEPGLIYVRVCLGNSGALPIAVTDPAVMLAEVPLNENAKDPVPQANAANRKQQQVEAIANQFAAALRKRQLKFLTEDHLDALRRELHDDLSARMTHPVDEAWHARVLRSVDIYCADVGEFVSRFENADQFMRQFETLKCHLWMALDRDELTPAMRQQLENQLQWYRDFAKTLPDTTKGKKGMYMMRDGSRAEMTNREFRTWELETLFSDPLVADFAWPLNDQQFAKVQQQIRRPEWLVVKEPKLETITTIILYAVAEQQAKRIVQRWPIPNEWAVWDGFGRNRWRWDSAKAGRTWASLVDEDTSKPDAQANIEQPIEFRGSVRDTQQRPVTRATIALSVVSGGDYERREKTVATTVVDESGAFSLQVLPSLLQRDDPRSKLHLWAWGPDVAKQGMIVAPIEAFSDEPYLLTLLPPTTERVQFVDERGQPVRAVVEQLSLSTGFDLVLPDALARQVLAQREINGDFELKGFPMGDEGHHGMWMRSPERGRLHVQWKPDAGEAVPTQLIWRDPVVIRGRLKAVAGELPAEVIQKAEIVLTTHGWDSSKRESWSVGHAKTRCDRDGLFVVRTLPPGSFQTEIDLPGITGWKRLNPKDAEGKALVINAEKDVDVDILFARTRPLQGQFIDADRKPLPDVELNVTHGQLQRTVRTDKSVTTQGDQHDLVRTDAEGMFSLEIVPGLVSIGKQLAPGSNLSTAVRWPSTEKFMRPDGLLEIAPGETPFVLPPMMCTTLTGRVIDQDERPVKALVFASRGTPPETTGLSGSDDDGRFRMETIGEAERFQVMPRDTFDTLPPKVAEMDTILISREPLVLQVVPRKEKAVPPEQTPVKE